MNPVMWTLIFIAITIAAGHPQEELRIQTSQLTPTNDLKPHVPSYQETGSSFIQLPVKDPYKELETSEGEIGKQNSSIKCQKEVKQAKPDMKRTRKRKKSLIKNVEDLKKYNATRNDSKRMKKSKRYKKKSALRFRRETDDEVNNEDDGNGEKGAAEAEESNPDDEEGVVVKTISGFVRGVEYENPINEETFFAFLGIPYAAPPVGPLRFMPPEPPEPWEGIRDFDKQPEPCIQIDPIGQSAKGEEDCLKLMVYTPMFPSDVEELMPVIMYIHGGIYHGGEFMADPGPEYVMTQDVILVGIHYRLGVFGFLSFQDEVVPGNMGLKDQVMALRWVRNNIRFFGGDRNKVTIFGFSAGAAAAHLHMLSSLSRGLFHRVIAFGGTAISLWAMDRHPKDAADFLAAAFNCSTDGSKAVLKCLQAAEADDLTISQYNAFPIERMETDMEVMMFAPCVEPMNTSGAFITEDPYEILRKREETKTDVPLMMGIASDEASIVESILSLSMIPKNMRKQGLTAFSKAARVPKFKPFVGTERMAEEAISFYFNGTQPSLENLDELVEMVSDIAFLIPMQDSVKLHLLYMSYPVYEFFTSIDTDFSFVRGALFFAPPKGNSHGDFVYSYFFYNTKNPVDPEHDGYKMAMNTVKMFANFAETGNPTPDNSLGFEWRASTIGNRYFLNMNTTCSLEKDLLHERVTFWEKTRKKEGFHVGPSSNG